MRSARRGTRDVMARTAPALRRASVGATRTTRLLRDACRARALLRRDRRRRDRRSNSRRRRPACTATTTSGRCSGPRGISTSSTSRESRRGRSQERRAEAVAAEGRRRHAAVVQLRRLRGAVRAHRRRAPRNSSGSSRGRDSGRRGPPPSFLRGYLDAAGQRAVPAAPIRRSATSCSLLPARQGALRVELRAEQPARLGAHPAVGNRSSLLRSRRSRRRRSSAPSPSQDGVRFRVWAPAARAGSTLQLEAADGPAAGSIQLAPIRATAACARLLETCIAAPRPVIATRIASTAASPFPTRRRASSRTACTAHRKSSTRTRFAGTTRAGAAPSAAGPGHLRAPRRHVHAGGHLRAPRANASRTCATSASPRSS